MANSGATNHKIEELLDIATVAPRLRRGELVAVAVDHLCAFDDASVNTAATRHIMDRIALAWSWGWQPKELHRQVRRNADAPVVRLALIAIAADHTGRDASTLDPRWAAQLVELQLPRISAGGGWLTDWASSVRLRRHDEVAAMVGLLQSLDPIQSIPILIPPPGTSAAQEPTINLTEKSNDPMLSRVRALLAQAESTTFEAEAETFTAKAQELMTRHAIYMAMIAANSRRSERPDTIRIAIDEPYVEPKSILLHIVAERSRCAAVLHDGLAMSSVVGFAADLDATEMLYTSLLVQAQTALRAATTTASAGPRARTRAFRSSFLRAYAQRVAERLDEINDFVIAEAEAKTGQSILPVLAARSEVVDEAVGEMFTNLSRGHARRRFDAEGWACGRMAADRAQLNDRVLSG
jgi:hypothetical protein